MKRYRTILFACVILATGLPAPAVQRELGSAPVSGHVTRSFKLSLGRDWPGQAASINTTGATVSAHSISQDSIQVAITGSGPDSAAHLVLPIEMRTNAPYDLKLIPVWIDECAPGLLASIIQPRATGSSVMPGVQEASQPGDPIDLRASLSPATLLRGPRISALGTFSSPGNALAAGLHLSIPQAGDRQCRWRVTFRISLLPAS
jgi:hypothetical protein